MIQCIWLHQSCFAFCTGPRDLVNSRSLLPNTILHFAPALETR